MRVEDDVRIKVNGEVSHHGAATFNAIHPRYCNRKVEGLGRSNVLIDTSLTLYQSCRCGASSHDFVA